MALSEFGSTNDTGSGDPSTTSIAVALDNSGGKAVALYIAWYESIPTVDSFYIDIVQFAGVDLVKMGEQRSGGVNCEIWALSNAPASSDLMEVFFAGDVVGGYFEHGLTAVAYTSASGTSVNFGTLVGNIGSSTSASVTDAKVGEDGTVYGVVGTVGITTSTAGAATTGIYESSSGRLAWGVARETTPVAGATPTLAWTVSAPGDNWNAIAIEVQENSTAQIVYLPILGTG